MTELTQERFGEEEKVKILLQEYATLRSEILTRTTNLYQLIAIGAWLFVWTMGQSLSARFWVALFTAVLIVSFFYRLISRDIDKAATRLRELEQDINFRAGEALLVWETRWGGAVTGHWGRGEPLPADSKRRTRDDLRPTPWEQLVAPSLRLWTSLAKYESIPPTEWSHLRDRFDAAFPSSESRIRIAIGVLATVTLALVGLAAVIGGSLTFMGRLVSMDPTDAPRWIEVLVVATVAFLAAWGLKSTAELRRRVEWQARVLREIEESAQLLSSSQDTRHE